ncbi:MAG: tol-pal system protein YbgF [Deltaproteobacteria bacterium]|nr:tol-pal system protein YbgF [Deltaproteobacteria bacterium]
MGRRWIGLCVLVGGIAWAAIASADELGALKERVRVLEQSLREVQAVLRDRGTATAEVGMQADQARVDLQAIHGSIDGVAQQLRRSNEEANRFRQDVDERLRTIEEQMRLAPRPATMPATTPSPSAPPTAPPSSSAAVSDPVSQEYQKALSLVHAGDYLNAANAFRQFVQTNSRSALAPNAQFWVGDCYFAMKDYQRAIKEYQVVAERFPRHEKANTALYKQGLAFENLGMKEEAKLFWQKLVAKAPQSPEAKKAADRLKNL